MPENTGVVKPTAIAMVGARMLFISLLLGSELSRL
jgi:hypothetical protein